MSQLILNDIKDIVKDTVQAINPADIIMGVIYSVDPLVVEVDKNTDLYVPDSFLLPEHLTDREVTIRINGQLENIIIYDGLKVGDAVYMIKSNGGQHLLILDRVAG